MFGVRLAEVAVDRLSLFVAVCALSAAFLGACLREAADEPLDPVDYIRAVDLSSSRSSRASDAPAFGGKTGKDAARFYYGKSGGGAAASARRAGKEEADERDGAQLNFESSPVAEVAKVVLGDLLGQNYAIDPRVQGAISLSSSRPVPRSELLPVLESALQATGSTLVRDKSGYHIVPVEDAVGRGSVDRARDDRRSEPGYGVTVIPLRYVSAPNILKIVDGFAIKGGVVRAEPANNLLIVVGNSIERQTVVDTVSSFDVDWMRQQSVAILPVQNTTAELLIAELEKILDLGETGMGRNLVKLQAVNRSNAILVVATRPEMLRRTELWVRRLDGSALANSGVKVYRVRYGDARQIAKLLSDLFVGGGGGSTDTAAGQLAPGSGASLLASTDKPKGSPLMPTTSSTSSASPSSASASTRSDGMDSVGGDTAFASRTSTGGAGGPLLAGVRILADTVNNSVVVYANQENYQVIERALQQVDRPRKQVAIDLTIAEVTLSDQLDFGVQYFLGHSNLGLNANGGTTTTAGGGPVTSFNTSGTSLPLSTTSPGFNIIVGSKFTPHVIINALHEHTKVKVLSNPSLVVVDNQIATLQVGDQVPVSTGSATVLTTSNTIVSTVEYKNTGIILRVLPRINPDGNVLLDVEQEISSVPNPGTALSPNLNPTISERRVKSEILVADGQTVLLAGLIQDKQNGTRDGIPVLERIPIVGNAFVSNNMDQKARTELIIFIRPQIIASGADASTIAEELRSKMKGERAGSLRHVGHPLGVMP